MTSGAPKGEAKRAVVPPLVTFTLNLILKKLKIHHFLVQLHNLISLGLKIQFFQNFALATLGILHLAPPLANF